MLARLLLAAALILASPLSAGEPTSPAKPIAIEALATLPFLSDPQLSPDGRKVAAIASVGGKRTLAVFDVPTRPDQKPTVLASGSAFFSFRWAGNDRLLISRSTTLSLAGLPLQFTQLLRHELSSQVTIKLANVFNLQGDGVLFVDPLGRYILLASQAGLFDSPSVHRVSLDDGAMVEAERSTPGIYSWFADAEGVVRAGLEITEEGVRLHYRSKHGEPLRAIDTRKAPDERTIDIIRFVTDTNNGVVVTDSKTGRFGVYRYDFEKDTIGEAIFEHPEVDVSALVAGNGNDIEGILYVDDRLRVHWLNAELASIQRMIDRTFPGKSNIIIHGSQDRNKVLIWSGAADDPGTYYILDRRTRRLEAFASPYEKLTDAPFAPVKPVRYKARDGLNIPAYLTLPTGRSASRLPLVVLPHGGPFYRDQGDFDPMVQLLANRGYAVLQPNYRGSTGYGRHFVEKGYGQWGTGMIDDIDDGVDWLVAQGTVDPARVCIVGGSYGGYAAIWASIRSPRRYRCAVSIAGVTDIRAMLKYDAKYLLPARYSKAWRRLVEGEEKRDLAAISPLQQAKRLETPVLIAHGELDTNVPVAQSRDLVKALRKRGKPVESVFYPKSGHSFDTVDESVDFMKRLEAFLARYNPAG